MQMHHLIPNQVVNTFNEFLGNLGFKRNAPDNLAGLPTEADGLTAHH